MYGFDLLAWLRGEVKATPQHVIALLSGLPEDTDFSAHWQATVEQRHAQNSTDNEEPQELDEFQAAVLDNKLWGFQNTLLAQVVNAINFSTAMHMKDPESFYKPLGPARLVGEPVQKKSGFSSLEDLFAFVSANQ